MKVLVWDGPLFAKMLGQYGDKLHVTYDDLRLETTIDGVYESVEVEFGARVPAEFVREAQSFVDRGWAREDDEPGPAVPIPEPIPIPPRESEEA